MDVGDLGAPSQRHGQLKLLLEDPQDVLHTCLALHRKAKRDGPAHLVGGGGWRGGRVGRRERGEKGGGGGGDGEEVEGVLESGGQGKRREGGKRKEKRQEERLCLRTWVF